MKITFAALIALLSFVSTDVIAHEKKDVVVEKKETVTTEESKTSEDHMSDSAVVNPDHATVAK